MKNFVNVFSSFMGLWPMIMTSPAQLSRTEPAPLEPHELFMRSTLEKAGLGLLHPVRTVSRSKLHSFGGQRSEMGKKAKGSRKGKKAWRANIGTDDIEDFFEKSTKDALSGGSLAAVPSDSLFFVDKSSGIVLFPVWLPRKRRKMKEKVVPKFHIPVIWFLQNR